MPLPPEEKVEVLVFLACGDDSELSRRALNTLQLWDGTELRRVMAGPATPPEILQFAAERLSAQRADLQAVLLANPNLPLKSRNEIERALTSQPLPIKPSAEPNAATGAEGSEPSNGVENDSELSMESELDDEPAGAPDQPTEPLSPTDQEAVEILAKLAAGGKIDEVFGSAVEAPAEAIMRDDELTSRDRETLIQKIGRMTVVEKIKAALTGNMETRALLIRDSNKIISRAVLQSPKISETEAEGYAAAKNVSDEVLRLIASARRFRKAYTVVRALVNNPRAPIDVTMPLLIRINEKDLKGLTLNRNVPEVIRSLAIKMIKQREDASKSKNYAKH